MIEFSLDHIECCGPWALDSANLYTSCRRRLLPGWAGPRVPYTALRFSGPTCDRLGCDQSVPRADFSCPRFCSAHQLEHYDRLLAQIDAMKSQVRRQHGIDDSAESPQLPPGGVA